MDHVTRGFTRQTRGGHELLLIMCTREARDERMHPSHAYHHGHRVGRAEHGTEQQGLDKYGHALLRFCETNINKICTLKFIVSTQVTTPPLRQLTINHLASLSCQLVLISSVPNRQYTSHLFSKGGW